VRSLIGKPLEVEVRDNLEKAMKILKQKMSKEGILQEVKRRRFYEKPSVKAQAQDARGPEASSSRDEASRSTSQIG
jgi:small subunit ribosomal protein S21